MSSNQGTSASDADRGARRREMAASGEAVARWLSVAGGDNDTPRTRRLLRLVGSEPDGDVQGEQRPGAFIDHGPLVLYGGESWRLYPDGSLRRWDAAAQGWRSLSRNLWDRDEATFLGPDPTPRTVLDADGGQAPTLASCTCLGGTLQSLCAYGKYSIVFEPDRIKMLSHQAGAIEIPIEQVAGVDLGGRGEVAGPAGVAEIPAFYSEVEDTAPVLVARSLVDRTGMDSSIRIRTDEGDALFHCDCATPDRLRASLAPFLRSLRQERSVEEAPGRTDVAGALVKLADLKARGLLTDDEFTLAKAKVLEAT